MFKKPQITPVSIASNLDGFKCKDRSALSEEDSSSEEEKREKNQKKQRKRSPPPQQKLVALMEAKQKKQEAFQERFMATFEKYVDTIGKKRNEFQLRFY